MTWIVKVFSVGRLLFAFCWVKINYDEVTETPLAAGLLTTKGKNCIPSSFLFGGSAKYSTALLLSQS